MVRFNNFYLVVLGIGVPDRNGRMVGWYDSDFMWTVHRISLFYCCDVNLLIRHAMTDVVEQHRVRAKKSPNNYRVFSYSVYRFRYRYRYSYWYVSVCSQQQPHTTKQANTII